MARIVHFDQGDVWQPQASFTVAGTPTDPTTITARVKDPSGTVVVYGPFSGATGGTGLTRTAAGTYKLAIDLNDAGHWFARFEGTGAATASEEHQAVVDPSEFYEAAQLGSRALVGLAEAKDWLQMQNIDTGNDLELSNLIVDISDRMHYEAAREFKALATNPATRLFDVPQIGPREPWYVDGTFMGYTGARSRTIAVGDLASPTTVAIIDRDWTTVLETVSSTNYVAKPHVREPWEPIRELEFKSTVTGLSPGMRVSVAGNWGFPSVPGNVRRAVLQAVAAAFDRDVEHYSQDVGALASGARSGEGGNVIVLGAGRQRLLSLPPEAQAVAWSYRDASIG